MEQMKHYKIKVFLRIWFSIFVSYITGNFRLHQFCAACPGCKVFPFSFLSTKILNMAKTFKGTALGKSIKHHSRSVISLFLTFLNILFYLQPCTVSL
jgi:hypothetical protein